MQQAQSFPQPPAPDRLATASLFCVGRDGDATAVITEWCQRLKIASLDQVWLQSDDRLTIAQVRQFQQAVLLQPLAGRYRVGIIEAAQRLTPDASHALLKLLEDPPHHAIFFLATEFEDQLLPTIVSRCQRWRLPAATDRQTNQEFDVGRIGQLFLVERFRFAETWAKGDDFVARFDDLIRSAQQAFRLGRLTTAQVDRLLNYRSLAETNVLPRLLAETTLLALPEVTQ